ncbi:short-chain dehydrogenase [Pseudomonas sp. NZIPFR-PS5]|nr:short-chain dehydrogenase [Pseudomonas sp. NZIPFR-PS5]
MSTPKTALIIGASRGLGLGLVKRLTELGWEVTATVRDAQKADEIKAQYDLLFVNAGVMGPMHPNPTDATAGELGQLFLTNAVAPIRLAKRFVDQIRPETGVIAFMSSVLGSVTMPDAPEMALYKASKAALNSMTHTFVTQLADNKPTVVSMHPGWVRTAMGGEGADIDVETSVRGIVEQLERFAGKGGHHFVNYKGETIPW